MKEKEEEVWLTLKCPDPKCGGVLFRGSYSKDRTCICGRKMIVDA